MLLSPRSGAAAVALAAALLVGLMAVPRLPTSSHPSFPPAEDTWPGFPERVNHFADLAGIELLIRVDRRDEPLELHLRDRQGRGFHLPVPDLVAGAEQHRLGLIDPGDWRFELRRRGSSEPLVERRAHLRGGRHQGLVLDARDPSLAAAPERSFDGVLALPGESGALLLVHLDELLEARRRGASEPQGVRAEPVDPAGGHYRVQTRPGQHVLAAPDWSFEALVWCDPASGRIEPEWRLPEARAEIVWTDRAGEPLPPGTHVHWSVAPRGGEAAPFWRSGRAQLDAGPQRIAAPAGELRAVLQPPGERPLKARVTLAPGEQHVAVPLGPRPREGRE